MIRNVLARGYTKNETLGTWQIFSDEKILFTCKSLELPWLGNHRNHSCIPEGFDYWLIKITSPDMVKLFGQQKVNETIARLGSCFMIPNVKDRDGIMVHAGTFAYGPKVNTEGCIMVGTEYQNVNDDGVLDIIESRKTLDRLYSFLPDKSKLIIL